MGVWDFIQDQVLGMQWLNALIGMGLSALGLDVTGQIGGSIQFFIYDVLKITVLLCVLIFAISYIQSYFPPERSKRILGRFHGVWANIISALLGTVTPFCSCSSIPLFIGFTSVGLPACYAGDHPEGYLRAGPAGTGGAEAVHFTGHAGTERKSEGGAPEGGSGQKCRALDLGPCWPGVFCSLYTRGGLPSCGSPDGKEVVCRKKSIREQWPFQSGPQN